MKMSEDGSNQMSARINQKIAALSKTSNNPFIFKVHHQLRRENEWAYEPEMLSIGPYHHGKNNLQQMEKYKLEYLQVILKRQNETGAERYIAALMEVEEEACSYYADNVDFSPHAFVEMMLLDGCFIIKFLRKYNMPDQEKLDAPIFSMRLTWLVEVLCRGLLLLENQLPFFILAKLFEMTKIPGQEEDLIDLAISCLSPCNPADKPSSSKDIREQENIFHLLDLLYRNWCSTSAEEGDQNSGIGQKSCCFAVITFCTQLKKTLGNQDEDQEDEIDYIKSVRELEENGIKFKAAKESTPWHHISFKEGVIEIPTSMIEDDTESILRNLIAYEEYMSYRGISGKVVTDYATFMDCLINSSDDVKRLRHKRIIRSGLGNDEAISSMFNKISNNVILDPQCFSYSEVFKDVNKYCSQKRHTWKADLKKKYFRNPWSIISFIAATVLLLLTLVQTVFSVVYNCK